MSLLLDALQRASKEKEKTAAGLAPSEKPASPPTPGMALEPVLPSSPAEPTQERPPPPTPGGPTSPDTPLEFSFKPTPAPPPAIETTPPVPEKIEPTLTSTRPAVPAPRHGPADTPKPAIEPPAAPPERPAPQLSPQVAREILYANTGKPKGNKRLIAMIGIALVMAIALGGLFLYPLLNPPSGIALQPPPPTAIATQATTSPSAPVEANTGTPAASAGPVASDTQVAPQEVKASPAPLIPSASPAAPGTGNHATPRKPDGSQAPTPSTAKTGQPGRGKPVFTARQGSPAALEAAYKALTEGRFATAEDLYRQALRHNPDERDALLGLAHLAHRQGRPDEARSAYQRVLRLEPDHPVALAGLLALAEGDPEQLASRARDMAERHPESAAAQSALGSTLAREGLLAEAQQAFFKAMTLEADNPLHAYNLAVALDRLHKPDLARKYYERALALAEKSGPGIRKGFPQQATRDRLEQLRSSGTEGKP